MEVACKLRACLKPAKEYAVVREWKAQYADMLHRYKFLVVQGPSQTGKTEFCRVQCPAGRTLEINCAAAEEPMLRDYDSQLHDMIIFDEASPKMVVRQRKLFQAQHARVDLALSSTSCHSYSVWLYRKMLCICTNRWHDDQQELSHMDRDWLEKNCFLLEVTEPMFIDT